MRPPWHTPGRDFLRRFTRRGRAQLRVKRTLLRIADEERERLWRVKVEQAIREDRRGLFARFAAWTAEEDRRIHAETLDYYQPLYPGVPRSELMNVVEEYRRLAKELPLEPPAEEAS